MNRSLKVINNNYKLFEELEDKKIDTLAKAFEKNAYEKPYLDLLGTRDDSQPGRPYVWKSYSEVNEIATHYTRGCMKLGMLPEIKGDGRTFRFMGIYAKNREEWIITDIANMKNAVTTVAFYDTLGPAAVEFVINQTELTSISCSGNYVPGLIKLKEEGKAQTI